MSQPSPYSSSFVDHHLQVAILERLKHALQPLRFSDLKDEGVENSLFMYHMNKLINRGVVQRLGQGFALSPKGAKLVNIAGSGSALPMLPRPLVQYIIRSGEQMLVARRQGRMGELLNAYMLPGGLHTFGRSAEVVARDMLAGMLPHNTPRCDRLTTAEIIVRGDGYAHHVLSTLFGVELKALIAIPAGKSVAYEWHKVSDINSDNPDFASSPSLTAIVEKVRGNDLYRPLLFDL